MSRRVLKDFIVGLRHVGHIVDDLQRSVDSFQKLYGLDDDDITVIPPYEQDAVARFALINVAGTEFELIQPLSEDMVATLSATASGSAGINHVAYQVDDIVGALAVLGEQGVHPGHVTPEGIVDTGRSKIVYLNPEHTEGLLVELVEIYPR